MKYIDAEKQKGLNGDFHDGVVFTVDEIKEIIDYPPQEQPEVDIEKEEYVGVAESPLKTFQRVNEFESGASYRH